MLFLFGNAQDAADMGAEVRRAAGENSKTVEYDVQRDHRKFSLSGKYQNEVQTSEIISRSSGATDCYFADTRRRGRFLSLFSFQAESRSKAVWTSIEEAHLVRTADLVFETIGGTAG